MASLKSFRACFYRKQNGCAPFYASIVCQTLKTAKAIATNENARLVSITLEP